MPDPQEVERAAAWLTIEELGAVRTRRFQRTRYGNTDLLGADVLAWTPDGVVIVDASKGDPSDGGKGGKRRDLERLGGEDPVPVRSFERRLLAWWDYERVGRGTRHFFTVDELVHPGRAAELPRAMSWDGRSAELVVNGERFVWARWDDTIEVPEGSGSDWYTAP